MRKTRMMLRRNTFLILFALLVSACAQGSHPMGKPLPTLSYDHLMPYYPFQGSVNIRQSAVLTPETLLNAKEFVIAPQDLINRYAQSRFASAETAAEFPVRSIFDVQTLSLNKKSDEDNMMGILTGAAAEFYMLDLFVTLSPVRSDGFVSEPYTIKIKRELIIPDNITLAEKEFRQFEFLENVIQDIDRTVTGFMPHMR